MKRGIALEPEGRDAELHAIDRLLDEIRSGFRALAFMGEAGIGKTTLWMAGIAAAERRSYHVLACKPVQSETKLSYAALSDLLGEVADGTLPQIPGPQRRALDVALLRSEPEGRPPDLRLISTAFLSVIRFLARKAPVLIAVDDVQWLDRPSARVLEFAIRRLGPSRAGALLTLRSEEPGVTPIAWIDSHSAMSSVKLGPLSLGAIHQILSSQLGEFLPRPVLVRIVDESRGNPFFAIEIARGLREQGSLPPLSGPLPLPDDLSNLVAERIDRLPPRVVEILLVAAAVSRPTVSHIQSVSRPSSARDLSVAVSSGIIDIEGENVRFTHPLLRSAVYASASEERKRRLHRRLAGIARDGEERSMHLALSARGPNETVAAELEVGARLAYRRGAPDTAAELLESAWELTPKALRAERRSRRTEAARYHFRAGDRIHARAILEEVIEESPPGVERAQALALLAEVRYHMDSYPDAQRLLEQALDEAGQQTDIRARIELDLAYAKNAMGDLPGSRPHAHAALSGAQQLSDDGLLAESLAVVTVVDFLLGEEIDWNTMRRAVALEDPEALSPILFRPSYILTQLLWWTGQLNEARTSGLRLRQDLLEHAHESALPLALFTTVNVECWRGDLSDAERHGNEALEISSQLNSEAALAVALTALALAHAFQGSDAAREESRQAVELFTRSGWSVGMGWALWAVGHLEVSLEQWAAADRALQPLTGFIAEIGLKEPTGAPFVPDHIEALIALGDLERAESLLELLEDRGRAVDRPWALAAAARCRALLSASRGDLEGALASADHALREHDRVAMPLERARTVLVKGQILRRHKEKRAAKEALDSAFHVFHAAGARLWAERTRREASRVGLRPRAPLELTHSERRVAELAARGHTNIEIASALFLSVRTVESNLTRAYRKLGVRSRAELAVGLNEPPTATQAPVT